MEVFFKPGEEVRIRVKANTKRGRQFLFPWSEGYKVCSGPGGTCEIEDLKKDKYRVHSHKLVLCNVTSHLDELKILD